MRTERVIGTRPGRDARAAEPRYHFSIAIPKSSAKQCALEPVHHCLLEFTLGRFLARRSAAGLPSRWWVLHRAHRRLICGCHF